MLRIVLYLVLLLAGACSRELPEGVTELVYATPYPPSHPFSRADRVWMDFVNRNSGGSLHIVPNWSGALLSSEYSMLELRHGVADIGLITPIYIKGGTHLIRLQSGFYSGITSTEQQVALYHCLAATDPQFARELAGLRILAVQGGSLPGILTTHKRVESLNDLQGLRLRVPTELLGVMRELGADPVIMPMGDVYSALAKGMLDGVVAPMDTFRSLHFAEVVRYYAGLKIPRGAYPARAMSQERWAQLSGAQRRVLEQGVGVWQAALAQMNAEALEQGRVLALKEGVQFTSIPARDQARFDELYLNEAAHNAEALRQYGIDGPAVFATARASIGAEGHVSCRGGRS